MDEDIWCVKVAADGSVTVNGEEVPPAGDTDAAEMARHQLVIEAAGAGRAILAEIDDVPAGLRLRVRVHPDGEMHQIDEPEATSEPSLPFEEETELGAAAVLEEAHASSVSPPLPQEQAAEPRTSAERDVAGVAGWPSVLAVKITESGTGYVDGIPVDVDGDPREAIRERLSTLAADRGGAVRAVATDPDGSIWVLDVNADGVLTPCEPPDEVALDIDRIREHLSAGRIPNAWLLARGLERDLEGRPAVDPTLLLVREHLAVLAYAAGDSERCRHLRAMWDAPPAA